MGKNTFTIDLEGQKRSVTIDIAEPEFIKGWWTTDKEGKNTLAKSKLGETVYFHVETRGLAAGKQIGLKLGEWDYSLWLDDLDPDDYEFPEETVIKKATVKQQGAKKIATVALFLDEQWQGVIKDDHDQWWQSNESIELYWEVTYGNTKEQLPKETDSYLRVAQSDRTLYFKSPGYGHSLPQLMSTDGSPMILMNFIQGKAIEKAKSKASEILNKKTGNTISNIALAKLDKGSLIANNGKVYTNSNAHIYNEKTLFTNDAVQLKNVKKRKNFGFKDGDDIVTTKGLSQYDYFTKTGKRVKLLGFLKEVLPAKGPNIFDYIDLFSYATDDSNPFDEAIPDMGLGALGGAAASFALIFTVAGILVKQMKAEDDIFMEEIVQLELLQAKENGLAGIEKFVNDWGHNEKYKYVIEYFTQETINNILFGKFENLADARFYDSEVESLKPALPILYRTQMNNNKERTIEVIDTIIYNW